MKATPINIHPKDVRILSASRIAGYLFAFLLLFTIGMSMVPNQFFVVSPKAVINAPVQMIASPIYGRVDNVFDETYRLAAEYGTPGRAVYGGVRLRFN